MATPILLIEDDAHTASLLARTLQETGTFDVTSVRSAEAGLSHLANHRVDCVLLDYRLPDFDGLECLRNIRRDHPSVPVVLITGAGSEELAVEAMKLGAVDYLVKHGKFLSRVPTIVREALGRREIAAALGGAGTGEPSLPDLDTEAREHYRRLGIVGESPALEQVLAMAERAAQSRVGVLLEGETGTGKEVLAHAIHARGPRASQPFLAVNCAALPETLLESELFGHVKGAFTGADRSRLGLFREADGGTLFLDEIGETTPNLQAKLLRAVQDGVIRPVGGSDSHQVDVRVIAATNRDLRQESEAGRFRLDLYYRIRVFPIRLPPLRERAGDVALLAKYFLERLSRQEGKHLRGFDPTTLALLERYAWPGNIRELQNEIHRLVLYVNAGQRITIEVLPPWIVGQAAAAPATDGRSLKEVLHEVEAAVINQRLRQHGYRREATAKSLGVTREWLWAKIRQLGLVVPSRRPRSEE